MNRCWNCCGLSFEGEVCPNCGELCDISLGEGNTPLFPSRNWPNVWIKDERQNPTGTFKDRQAALIVSRARKQGVSDIVVASTGNTVVSCAAYAAEAGLRLWAFLPVQSRGGLCGEQVTYVEATYDETKGAARRFAEERGFWYVRGLDYTEAMADIAREILAQLGHVPQWYVQAVSGGIGPIGVWRGFQEYAGQGPELLVVQDEGCAPMVWSAQKGLGEVEAVERPSPYAVTLGRDQGSYGVGRDGDGTSGRGGLCWSGQGLGRGDHRCQ
jgi:threonine synthase